MKSIRSKFIVLLISFSAVILIGVTLVVYFMFSGNIMNIYSNEANRAADLVASMLDGDRMYDYAVRPEEDAEYTALRKELVQVKENITNIKYLYVFVPISDEKAVYIYDIYTEEEYAQGDVDEGHLGFLENFSPEILGTARIIFYSNEDSDELEVTHSKYGYLASAYAPVYGDDGMVKAIVGIDYQMAEIDSMIGRFVVIIVLIIAMITLLAVVILLLLVSRTIISPIRLIDRKATEYASSEHQASAEDCRITVNTRDEMHDLAECLNRMMSDIENYIVNIRQITAEKERIGAELNVATRIQADMLPGIFPAFPEIENLDLYAKMDPAKEVGGDFYDFFLLDENHIMLVMADVSGKGVPAALFMVIAKTLIKNHGQNGMSVNEICAMANNQLCEGNDDNMFVTAWVGLLELSTGKLLFTDAGHENPIVVHRDGTAEFIRPARKSLPLGAMEGTKYQMNETRVEIGDVLFLYTDGAPEATNSRNEMYGTERLMETLTACPQGNMRELLTVVRTQIDRFVGEADQFDDLTMLALRVGR